MHHNFLFDLDQTLLDFHASERKALGMVLRGNGLSFSEEIYQEDHVHINFQGYHLLDSCIVSEILNDYKAYGKN